MNYAVVGYGRMGRAIDELARSRGHRRACIIDPGVGEGRITPSALRGIDVAFEFSTPATAESNVLSLVEARVSVVCGTTGWEPARAGLGRALRESGTGAVVASNFSVGMNLFYALVEEAGRRFTTAGLYDPFVLESHHRGKLDAPSGTARVLADKLREASGEATPVEFGCPATGGVAPGTIQVASVRAGHDPGTHTVGFDGEHDVVRLTHQARGRGGFALGAVLAGEWVSRGEKGLHGFERVLHDWLEKGGTW